MSDEGTTMDGHGRCDHGSDVTIVSSRIAESAVVRGIGRLRKIKEVSAKAALKDKEDVQECSFSISWTAPRLVMELAPGQLKLLNVTFLVADDLAEEDLLIGFPVLGHLGFDSITMLENNRSSLDASHCVGVNNPSSDSTSARARNNIIDIAINCNKQ